MKHSNKRQTPLPKSKQPPAKPPAVGSPGGAFPIKNFLVYGTLIAAMLFVFFVRFRLLSLPLERDEGEYALMGQLILKGIPPYEMAYNMKLPGTYYAYALLMAIFGQSPEGIHAGLLVMNLASMALLFFIGKKLVNETVGVLAAVSFGLLTLAPYTLGLSAHATHFNALAALGGFYLLLTFTDRPTLLRLVSSGFCFGLAFIMKQQAVFILFFGLAALVLFETNRKPRNLKSSLFNLVAFGFSLVLPYLLVVLVAVATGSFDNFWHWTVEYAQQYATIKPWDQAWGSLKANFELLSIGLVPFWLVGAAGLVALFFSESARKYRWTILAFTLFSALCVVPGLYFRQHYFIVFYPALALLAGIALNFVREWLIAQNATALSVLPFGFFAYMFFACVNRHTDQLFKDSPERLCTRMFGSANPFPESLKIAEFIRNNSKPDDKVAVLGSEPQICFYSDRLPATGFIYTYPLMENQAYSAIMQQEMIVEIEKSKPKFLVYVNSPLTWLRKEHSSGAIFEWFNEYKMQYKLAGIVEISPGKRTVYAWREALETHTERGETRVSVYERE
ncbi:MAG: ArnT family glycosyltransferase [Saprospiraceae bacterium]